MRKALILLSLILVALTISLTSGATTPPKKKYPGGKCYIYRYTLENKGESSYTLDRPQRWLSHKSIERRKKQGLALDSTDLPVSTGYLKAIERIASEANRATRKLTDAEVEAMITVAGAAYREVARNMNADGLK